MLRISSARLEGEKTLAIRSAMSGVSPKLEETRGKIFCHAWPTLSMRGKLIDGISFQESASRDLRVRRTVAPPVTGGAEA